MLCVDRFDNFIDFEARKLMKLLKTFQNKQKPSNLKIYHKFIGPSLNR